MKPIELFLAIKRNKKIKVIGYPVPGLKEFAVTADINNRDYWPWTITHIPTGMQVYVFYKSISAAQSAAKKYLFGINWERNYKTLLKDPEVIKKLKEICEKNEVKCNIKREIYEKKIWAKTNSWD